MEGDGPSDYIDDLAEQIEEDIAGFFEEEPSEANSARLGAAIGVLLQVSAYSFESDFARALRNALNHQSKMLSMLPEDARKILEAVARGKGPELAKGTRILDVPLGTILGKGW